MEKYHNGETGIKSLCTLLSKLLLRNPFDLQLFNNMPRRRQWFKARFGCDTKKKTNGSEIIIKWTKHFAGHRLCLLETFERLPSYFAIYFSIAFFIKSKTPTSKGTVLVFICQTFLFHFPGQHLFNFTESFADMFLFICYSCQSV